MRTFVARAHTADDVAELLGERFVLAVTSGEELIQDVLDEEFVEELGGPFVETRKP
jgi:hypothetical protein